MKQLVFFSAVLLSMGIFANDYPGHAQWGNAYHSGTGKVFHQGDFIEFTLSFDARCHSDRERSWNYVTKNVATFLDWLNLERANVGNTLDYEVEPVSVWKQSQNPYNYDVCDNAHFANQTVKVTLHRGEGASSLHADLIQNFYGRLQGAVWPLSFDEIGDLPASVSSTVSNIEKGIYEESVDRMRIDAKAKAKAKASSDFMSFLGEDYRGTWYLQSVDFRERDFSSEYFRSSVESSAPIAIGGQPEIPAQLKLRPISLSITGNFLFIYEANGGANN